MVFKDKLNLLMETLDASGTQIAAFAGFDRSNISHFRRGSKTPKPSGRTARKLVLGLCRYAESKGMKETLCSIAGTSPDLSEEVLCRKLSGWLFEGLLDPAADKNSAGGTGRVIAFQSFADRLDAAMTLASLSNIRLSQMICVDASLISRYRSGERSPRSNPDLAAQISEILWQRIQKSEKMPELLQLMHTPGGEVSENEFANWLCQFDTPIDSGASSAEKLLKKFDSYSAEISFPLPSFSEAAPESVLRSRKDRYDGTEGLRTAVIRFLGNVVLSGARELYLYSDQNMEWMTGDQEFLMKWAALMSACVKSGVRIRIIHNIDRNLQEMSDAITSWLPLYMSGMIESFYSRKKNDGKFTHTLFLCPGYACINAWHVTGAEAGGIYHYDTDPKILSFLESSFQELLAFSLPLVRIIPVSADHLYGGIILLKDGKGSETRIDSPLKNMMITISQDDVLVTRATDPHISFHFTHPLMYLAFRAYAEELTRKQE